MKPEQLELFEPSPLVPRGTDGKSLIDLAAWTLDRGVGRLSGRERTFLYGVLTYQWPISMGDAAEIYRLHQRIGKQQETQV